MKNKVHRKIRGIIFTDFDESLLKDNKYDPNVLDLFIKKLIDETFIIVALTSKTYVEVKSLYKNNNILFPFSSENGACYYLPYINTYEKIDFYKTVNTYAVNGKEIVKKLNSLPNKFHKLFSFITELNIKDQLKITKLKKKQLSDFYSREFSVAIV